MMDSADRIGAKVRGARVEAGLTQDDLASILDLERKAVGARESGRIPFSGAELLRLATVLHRPVSDFFPAPGHEALLSGEVAS